MSQFSTVNRMDKPIKYADALHRIAKANKILQSHPDTMLAFHENFKNAANHIMPWFQAYSGYMNFMKYHRLTIMEAYWNTAFQVTIPEAVEKRLRETGLFDIMDSKNTIDKPRLKNTIDYCINGEWEPLTHMMRFHRMMMIVETGRRTIGMMYKPMV